MLKQERHQEMWAGKEKGRSLAPPCNTEAQREVSCNLDHSQCFSVQRGSRDHEHAACCSAVTHNRLNLSEYPFECRWAFQAGDRREQVAAAVECRGQSWALPFPKMSKFPVQALMGLRFPKLVPRSSRVMGKKPPGRQVDVSAHKAWRPKACISLLDIRILRSGPGALRCEGGSVRASASRSRTRNSWMSTVDEECGSER